jgi:hypothetical protein
MGTANGTVIGSTKVVDHGPNEDKWCLVITGDGFTSAEIGAFASAVDDHVTYLQAHLTGSLNWDKVNIIRLDVASDESGADNTNCDGTTVDTYFDAECCVNGIDRTLVVDETIVIDTANREFPEWDALLVLVNTTAYGGATRGGVAAASLDPLFSTEIALHELGHAAFGLADEYSYKAGCDSGETTQDLYPNANGEPVEDNITNTLSPLKWAVFVDPTTAIPTTSNPDCSQCDPQLSTVPDGTVGAFEGAGYYHCNCWRPEFNCRMRILGLGFCAVCSARINSVLLWSSLLDVTPCFVAGAVYGDDRHPDVIALRNWRDRHLEPGVRGRTAMRVFADVYRYVGPHLAEATRSRPRLARYLRRHVLAPWAQAVRPEKGHDR